MASTASDQLLKSQAKKLKESLHLKDKRHRNHIYKNCFVGSQAVEVIQQLGFASNTSEAEAFGGKLIAAKIVKHVDEQEETIKDDIFFYQFIMDLSAAPDIDTSNEQQAPFKINRRPRDDSDPKRPAASTMASNQKKPPTGLQRTSSTFDFAKPKNYNTSANVPFTKTIQIGKELLHNASTNKGLAFTFRERRHYHLHGLLPPVYRNLDTQAKQIMNNINRMKEPLDQYVFFMNILDTNAKLFYRTLCENLPTLMPIVYTPTVGLACQKFGDIFVRPRGMYITIKDKGRIYQMLKNWPTNDVRAICFTDGERILGLGDLGAQGMGIPIGKLALYTGCAGVKPHQLLPVCIDTGCNTKKIREGEFYIGIREERCRSKDYDELIEEFLKAACHRWGPSTLLQFEDFGNSNAFRLLEKFKDQYCTFNDDIQGTAAVALAGVYSALRVKGCISKLSEHTFVMFGAGSAGVGISNLIVSAICKESGKLPGQARKQIWLVDSRGVSYFPLLIDCTLVFKGRKSGGITKLKEKYAHEWNGGEIKALHEIVAAVKGTAIMGVSGQGQTFTEAVCKAVHANNPRPLIFPMSNPTSKAECSAEQAFKWTNNQCIFASGSPFPRMTVKLDDQKEDVEIIPAQGNNAYIFPGVALGVIASRSMRIPDDMFLLAAQVLSGLVSDEMLARGTVYPALSEIRDVSFKIAVRIAAECYRLGIATEVEPTDLEALIRRTQYNHLTNDDYYDTAFDNLEADYGEEDF